MTGLVAIECRRHGLCLVQWVEIRSLGGDRWTYVGERLSSDWKLKCRRS